MLSELHIQQLRQDCTSFTLHNNGICQTAVSEKGNHEADLNCTHMHPAQHNNGQAPDSMGSTSFAKSLSKAGKACLKNKLTDTSSTADIQIDLSNWNPSGSDL